MKKSNILFIFLLIIPWLNASAQGSKCRLDFSAYTGYATYDMAGLKGVNYLTHNSLPFEVKNINNFNPGYYYGGSLRIWLKSYATISEFYEHYSTGSRIGDKDYSGTYTFDQIVDGDLIGLEPEVIFANKRRFSISASLRTGALFSKVIMKEYFKVGESETHYSTNLSATSFAIIPSLKLSVQIIDPVGFFISAGGMLDTGGKVHLPGNRNAVLKADDEAIRAGWSGIRLSAGIKINLTK